MAAQTEHGGFTAESGVQGETIMKWLIFLIYWISLVYTVRQGDLWMWLILMPSFLLLWMWAEEQDQDNGPCCTWLTVCV